MTETLSRNRLRDLVDERDDLRPGEFTAICSMALALLDAEEAQASKPQTHGAAGISAASELLTVPEALQVARKMLEDDRKQTITTAVVCAMREVAAADDGAGYMSVEEKRWRSAIYRRASELEGKG